MEKKADCSHLPEGYLPLNKKDDMKHTPAPWIFYVDEKHSNDMGRIIGLNETEICGFGDSSPYDAAEGFIPRKEDLALILAAPELLEALIEAVNEYKKLPHSLGYDFTHLPKMEKAIAKAMGK